MNYEIVKLGKKDLPMYYGFNALRKFCRKTGKSLNDLATLGNDMSLDDVVELIFHGTQEGHRRAGVDFTLTADDIGDACEGDSEGMQRCLELFGEHMGNTFKDQEGKKEKKQNPSKSTK